MTDSLAETGSHMEDLPARDLPADAAWSENFCLAAFDPRLTVDVFLHLGRWRHDRGLWRETVMIALPDGSVIGHRSIGNARATSASAGGPCLEARVLKNGARLRWSYLGAARRVAAEDLWGGLLRDGPLQRLEIDLLFDSQLPVWDISNVGHKTEFMGRGHVEQIGRVRGSIRIGQQSFDLDTVGNRDHSRGARDFSGNRRHIWMHGTFDNGISFLGYEAEIVGKEGPAFSELAVYDGGRIYPAKLDLGFRLAEQGAYEQIRREVPFSVDYDKGRLEVVAQRFPTTLHGQATAPNDMYVGVRNLPGISNTSYIEQSVHYLMNGSWHGYGHMERTLPGIWLVEA